eukprot:1078597-Amphidinium_carterae.1
MSEINFRTCVAPLMLGIAREGMTVECSASHCSAQYTAQQISKAVWKPFHRMPVSCSHVRAEQHKQLLPGEATEFVTLFCLA